MVSAFRRCQKSRAIARLLARRCSDRQRYRRIVSVQRRLADEGGSVLWSEIVNGVSRGQRGTPRMSSRPKAPSSQRAASGRGGHWDGKGCRRRALDVSGGARREEAMEQQRQRSAQPEKESHPGGGGDDGETARWPPDAHPHRDAGGRSRNRRASEQGPGQRRRSHRH